jgi:sulfatase maturation enzyme AslB (radical SAM superfamily)
VANLSISTVCNQHCSYCFTQDHLAGSRADDGFLKLEDFDARLDFLERSGIDQARFLGGEPTLHPQFPELVARAKARGKKIVVFTNGLMTEDALACLEALSVTECTVLVNINNPAEADEKVFERQRAVLRRLGQCASLGFNIYRADFQLDFLLSLIVETGCRSSVRLGLAQPCLSGSNRYIYPHQYVAIGEKIVRFARAAGRVNATVEFDCGFVRCMFSDEDVQVLESLGADVGWRCNPILDVDIDGQVIYCYPLAQLGSLPLTPQVDAPTLRDAFESRTRAYRQAGVFQECSTCTFKRSGVCPGGCLAATIRRFRHTPFAVQVPQEVGA